MSLASSSMLDELALRDLAEELKCPLWTCLTDLLKNRQECPICKGPLRRRDIRGDPRIDRIATLVSQLQSLGGLDLNQEMEYQPMQPVVRNLPSRCSSGSQSKRKASGSHATARRGSGPSETEPAHGDAAAVSACADTVAAQQQPDAGAAQQQRQQRPTTEKPVPHPLQWGSRQSGAAAAASAAEDGPKPPAAPASSAAQLQQIRTFKRQKWKPADEQPEQKPQAQQPGQQPPTQQPQARRQQSAKQQSAKQQLQEAARQHAAKHGRQASELSSEHAAKQHGRRVAERKEVEVDPYDFHSSGSQPSAPQLVLVAPPGARATDPCASAASTADAAAGHSIGRGPGRAAKRPRSAASDQSAAAAGAAAGSSGPSQLSGQPGGRRIPGRLVPWPCSACTFENPASALKCEMCDGARSKQHAQPAAEPQPQRGGRGAATAKREPSAGREPSAERPAKRWGVSPAVSAAAPTPTPAPAPAATPAAEGTTSRKAAAARPGAGMTLVPSGMDAKGKARLAAFARAVGARMAPRNKWCDAVTHVVCGIATRDGTPKRTLTVMLGILTGKWVVSASWLPPPGSVRIANEQDHEVQGGPALGRLSRNPGGAPLLDGFEIHLAGNFGRRDGFAQLVKAAGARLLLRPPAEDGSTAKESTVASICLYDEDACSWGRGERPQHVWLVSSKWLSDTAFAYTVAPLEDYIVDGR